MFRQKGWVIDSKQKNQEFGALTIPQQTWHLFAVDYHRGMRETASRKLGLETN